MEQRLIGWIVKTGRKLWDGQPELDLRFDSIDLQRTLEKFNVGPIEVTFRMADENDEYVKMLWERPDLKKAWCVQTEGEKE